MSLFIQKISESISSAPTRYYRTNIKKDILLNWKSVKEMSKNKKILENTLKSYIIKLRYYNIGGTYYG